MIALHIEVPYASFRKSYARSFAETYPFPPPATVYGMLLSHVGEYFRACHTGVKLAFAYKQQPRIATTLRKLSRYKYGVASKQSKVGNAPDYIETLCNIEFICWVDSSGEKKQTGRSLEQRLIEVIQSPELITRTGLVCLGLSDDTVDDVSLIKSIQGKWHWLNPSNTGQIELPIWVDHVGSYHTRWQRFDFEVLPSLIDSNPSIEKFIEIIDPR
ncbi:type I-MYXAN CRISPR-associated protein Cas5/Cmx5/DevS [Synechococcus sp. PCC 6312]|uniref:type I-MYXAN CRISPR-associated protein Cas5/Cmx5/DevS n=1 Tax=Synechococcus sp. (strain ATCC 27167 / PCC 6312) TaxID=195253 RepID=UPI00029F2FFA|nr:type I-MYXAN CRISPR-associated protein Cas5/Cmx5/DevS [Synechococcus sp. PCC 6312]AFY60374.1 CRISPR-associated protein Cas5/DevS, subtype MYXAN [Synechococcus sp. PCC 6312]